MSACAPRGGSQPTVAHRIGGSAGPVADVDAPVAIGIDIGGTHLRAAIVTAEGRLVDQVRHDTPARSSERLLEVLTDVVGGFGGDLPVGIGIAGLVSPDGTVRYGPNIGIRNAPLARDLGRRLARPVTVVNDGSAAALAEQRVGAARGHRDVVMITLGTGVGGGLTIDGRLVVGRSGYAGEVGHVIVADGGRPCPCGNRGCIEAYASGTAITVTAVELLRDRGDNSSLLHDVDSLDGRAVTDAARRGDALAREALTVVGEWLGVALASMVNLLDPEVIVIGGGAATDSAPWLLPAAEHSMSRRLVGAAYREAPSLEPALLGDDAGTVGAGLFAAQTPDAARGGDT